MIKNIFCPRVLKVQVLFVITGFDRSQRQDTILKTL